MDDIKLVSFLSIEKDLASVMHVLGLICLGIYKLSPMRESDRMDGRCSHGRRG